MNPEFWLRTFPTSLLGIMSCYSTDVERGYVKPKHPGQVFHFVDLNECWMYLGDREPEAPRPKRNHLGIIVLGLAVILAAVELFLLWLAFKWMGLA